MTNKWVLEQARLEAEGKLAEVTAQRDLLLAACEGLCHAIKYLGKSRCASHYSAFVYEDGQEDNGIEYVETHWKLHPAICLMDAYEMGQATIAEAKGAAVAYLLRATFDADDQGYADGQVLDTEAEGIQDGQLTVVEKDGTLAEHTPGPWTWEEGKLYGHAAELVLWIEHNWDTDEITGKDADLALIAVTPNLLAACEEVEWECDAWQQMYCPWCHGYQRFGHKPTCQRQAAIAEAKGHNAQP